MKLHLSKYLIPLCLSQSVTLAYSVSVPIEAQQLTKNPSLTPASASTHILMPQTDQVGFFAMPPGGSGRAALIRVLPLQPTAAHALSANGRIVVGLLKGDAKGATELASFSVSSGERVATVRLPNGETPDALWVDDGGSMAGALLGERFVVFQLSGNGEMAAPIFERSSNVLVVSPSGKFVILVNSAGHISVVQTRDWKEVPEVERSVEAGLKAWFGSRGIRKAMSASEGPFVFPVVPLGVSADDRVVSIYLGENANTFVNMCMIDGTVTSFIELDKRVSARASFSATGRLFGVQVVPNSDDPAFLQSRNDFGYRVYDAWSGALLQMLPLSDRDWQGFMRRGASYFANDWSGWSGFAMKDAGVYSLDRATGQVTMQRLKFASSLLSNSNKLDSTCPAAIK